MPEARIMLGVAIAISTSCQAPLERTPLEPLADAGGSFDSARAEGARDGFGLDTSMIDAAPFEYLLARYDANGDETITAEEYSRQKGQLEHWDTTGDGVLTRDDFAGVELSMDEIMRLRKERVAGRYFQADTRNETLRVEEIEEAFVRYEGPDGDGDLTQEEFEAQSRELQVVLPGDDSLMMQSYTMGDPWAMLLRSYDADDTGTIALWELGAYLEEQEGAELRFDLDRCDGGDPGDSFERIDLMAGLAEGSRVPVLALTRLDGEGSVSLADLAHETPVALIFGSYT